MRDLKPMRRASLQRFKSLWSRCCTERGSGANRAVQTGTDVNGTSVDGFGSSELGVDLLERYSESGRRYHTIDHIDHCLGQFDEVRSDCRQPDAVELAIWFHDAIYNFPAYQNEKLSAAFFMERSEHLLNTGFRDDVFDLVIATEHTSAPEDHDQRILVDVDLSSFGLPWDRFASDGKNIRQELIYLSDADFYAGQIGFMEALLARDRIYNTAHFHDKYETIARANVARYLESLSERGFHRKGHG